MAVFLMGIVGVMVGVMMIRGSDSVDCIWAFKLLVIYCIETSKC